MLICGDAELAQLDRDLAQLYAQPKAAAPDKKAFAKESRRRTGIGVSATAVTRLALLAGMQIRSSGLWTL
jgi:uncharacterized protein